MLSKIQTMNGKWLHATGEYKKKIQGSLSDVGVAAVARENRPDLAGPSEEEKEGKKGERRGSRGTREERRER